MDFVLWYLETYSFRSVSNDTGTLLQFQLNFCVEGNIENNSDNDSFSDSKDNCPFVTNEDQSDIDNNGVGDICDLFQLRISL